MAHSAMLPDEEEIIMKITSFNPLIVTKDADSAVSQHIKD